MARIGILNPVRTANIGGVFQYTMTVSIIWLFKNKDKTHELSSNCPKMIKQNYSISTAEKEAEKILEYLNC